MELATRQLWLFLAIVPGVALIVLVRHYLKAHRQHELSIASDDFADDATGISEPTSAPQDDESSVEQSSIELRRAITSEAIALIAHQLAVAKERRQPIPFPASAVVAQAAASFDPMRSFDAVHSSEVNSVNIPSVNTTNGAVEPQVKPANPMTPAATATANAHSRRNWAELLARHPRAGGSATPLQTAAPKAVDQATGLTAKAPVPTSPIQPQFIQSSPIQSSPIQTSPVQNQPLGEISLPAGIHDGYVLSRLVQSRRPISGLVVSIGIGTAKEQGEGEARIEPVSKDVRQLVESLLGPHDFACASAPDEYLLIFPQDRGAAAQRKLGQIAQKLWDFQLQMLGRASILFSWGGVEVRGEAIDEAIASASDRMQETRRTRSARSLERHGLRIAG